MNLVADVGGTNVRFALAGVDGQLQHERVSPNSDDFGRLVREYLAEARPGVVDTFACAAAGPVDGGAIQLTNRALRLDPDMLGAASGAGRVELVNDFAALAHALPVLEADDLLQCGGGTRQPDAAAILVGAGTGLGVATGVRCNGGWHVIPSEAGHADLAPTDDRELAAWQALRDRHGRVSAETVLSGPGLQRLYAALGGREAWSPLELDVAADAGDPLACEARRLFTCWLGRVAGDLALAVDARGGVFLAGGIVPGWKQRFDHAGFRFGFEQKSPMVDRLRAIPSFVITHPYPALLGLARLAAEGQRERRRG